MNYSIRLLNVLPLSLLLFPLTVQSQIPTVKALPFISVRDSELSEKFRSYQTYHLGTSALADVVRNENFDQRVNIELPGYGSFEIDLFENPLQASNYLLTLNSETGTTNSPGTGIVKTYRGNLKGGQYVVSLTIDHSFVQGFIQLPKNDKLQIEPLRLHVKSAPADAIIVYRASDQLYFDAGECGVKHSIQRFQKEQGHNDAQRVLDDCRTVQIAFADDWLMYDKYNQDVDDVENHNMAVINDTQNNYDTEFSDDLTFEVVQIWISTCSSCNPWSNSTSSGTLLSSFTSWGPTGFANTHDVGNLWTDRDFDGATIGISWLEAVCTSFRYLTCQDFSGNAGSLRTLLAHELGHNFGADHDAPGSNTIMAPSLVVTNTWSTQSITQINNYLDDINCLSLCSSVMQPLANFSSDVESGCEPLVVHFFDESTGPPSSWEWTFQGGTPSFSTLPNPTVTYQNPGTFDVVLEVSNSAGSNTIISTDYITVFEEPIADFVFNQIDLSLIFTNLSEGGDSYFWEFGDGGTSTQENPTYTYEQDGEYEVSLDVSNDCGVDNYTILIEVFVPPSANFSYSTDFGCAALVVQFQNESTNNVQDFDWIFPGGIPSSSSLENPIVTYPNAGFYSVTLIVENVAGIDEFTINNLIEVYPLPDADFNFSVNGLSVQFINASLNADTYLWSFGDGGTSTSQSPNHVYPGGGTYQVTLTSTNECGFDTDISTVVLNSAPVANFITSVSNGCAPLSVTYSSTSQGTVTSYNWSFPGGVPASSTAAMPTVTYQNAGTYDAQLIVGNAIGFDTLFLEDVVGVYTEVTSGFDTNVDGSTVDFLNTSTGASIFNWQVDGNTFIVEDLTYTFSEDGDYLVQLIASGQCGSDTTIEIIHISTPPTAGISSNTVSGCQPLFVQFSSISSSNANAFEWVFEGGIPSTSFEENPLVEYEEPGLYDVQLTVWSNSGSDILEISELINVAPSPVALFSTFQSGLDLEFTNASLNTDEYFWDFGDGNTSTEINPVHSYGQFGTYTVTLISENSCGSNTMTINVLVSGAPVPLFDAEQTSGCVPFEVEFIDLSQNGPVLWEWSFPGGLPDTSNLQNPVIVYDQPGIYRVILRVSNAGGAQAMFRDEYIHVAYPPEAEFDVTPNDMMVAFTNHSQQATQFFWFFGDGTVDTAEHPVHVYEVGGTFLVQLIAINACGTDTMTQEVTVTVTGVDNPGEGIDILLFPNPNEGTFTVRLDGREEEFELEVFDMVGKSVMYSQLIPNASGEHEFTLDKATSGVYTVVLRKPDFRHVMKMVVL